MGKNAEATQPGVQSGSLGELKDRSRLLEMVTWLTALAVLVTAVALILFLASPPSELRVNATDVALSVLLFLAVLIFLWGFLRRRKREIDAEIDRRQFELEMVEQAGDNQLMIRAEKLYRRNEQELARYYALNLAHNRRIFLVGIACVVASLLIVGASFYIFLEAPVRGDGGGNDKWTNGFVAFVGAVGTIMVNVVAAVFLQMHGKAVETLTEFHERLVSTSQLLLANSFAAQVDAEKPDSSERDKLFAELAKAIVNKG